MFVIEIEVESRVDIKFFQLITCFFFLHYYKFIFYSPIRDVISGAIVSADLLKVCVYKSLQFYISSFFVVANIFRWLLHPYHS